MAYCRESITVPKDGKFGLPLIEVARMLLNRMDELEDKEWFAAARLCERLSYKLREIGAELEAEGL